jgi:hypothetical protein
MISERLFVFVLDGFSDQTVLLDLLFTFFYPFNVLLPVLYEVPLLPKGLGVYSYILNWLSGECMLNGFIVTSSIGLTLSDKHEEVFLWPVREANR